MELVLFTDINTDRKQVDKSLFLAPPLRATSCNAHYSWSILYDNERETWSNYGKPGNATKFLHFYFAFTFNIHVRLSIIL
jgi:hypothetical protein